VLFLASDRELAEEAWAGDIIGIPNHGQLRIGDTLTEGEALRVTGIPSFAPELLQACRAGDPMKAKHLEKALMQFAEEGAAKVFKPDDRLGLHRGRGGRAAIRGAGQPDRAGIRPAGALRASQFTSARWVTGDKEAMSTSFAAANKQHIATTMTATWSTSRACNGTSTGSSAITPT
jgi:peptide chain release factor 3